MNFDELALEGEFYAKDFYFSYSSLNKLLYSPSAFYKHYILNEREDKVESYLITGKVIHSLILDKGRFDDFFVVVPTNLPGDSIRRIVDYIFKEHFLKQEDFEKNLEDFGRENSALERFRSICDQHQNNDLSADERKVFDDTFQIERLRQELDFCPRGDRYLGLKLECDKEINRLFLEESKDRKVLGKKLQLSTEVRIQKSDYRWSRNENRALVYQEETTHYLFHQRPYGVFEAKLPLFNYLVLSGFERPNKPKTVIKRIINQISPKTEEEREKVLSTAFDQIKEAMENGLLCCK